MLDYCGIIACVYRKTAATANIKASFSLSGNWHEGLERLLGMSRSGYSDILRVIVGRLEIILTLEQKDK